MLKKDFQKILNEEIQFSGKKFIGGSEEEKTDLYFRFAERYYDSLGYLTESSLENAFKKCREQFEYFPKINQLLKFCSTEKPQERSVEYNALPQSQASKDLMKKAMAGGSVYQVGEKTLRSNFAHLAQRWVCTNWDEALKREIKLDSLRLARESRL